MFALLVVLSIACADERALDAAEQTLAQGDPDAALATLTPLLDDGPWSHAQLVRLLRLVATARAFAGDLDGAVDVFGALLACEPGFTVPYTSSPKVTFAFQKAREQATTPIAVDVVTPPVARLDEEIAVVVRRAADARGQVTRLVLKASDRRTGDVIRFEIEAPPVGTASTVTLPARSSENAVVDEAGRPGVRLALQVTGLDRHRSEVFVGDVVELPVGYDARPATLWESPALWIGVAVVGVVIAGATSALLVVASLPPENVPVAVEVRR